MKRFLIKAILFLSIVFGLALGLDCVISKGLLKMEDYRFMSWNDMLNDNIEADVVILGNSRGFSHFEPWTIDSISGLSAYNLGLGGYPINVELMKYNLYCAYNHQPKYIVQQVDYMTIQTITAPHNHQSEQFLPLIYDRPIRNDLKRVGYTWKDLYIPLYRYWGYQMVIKNGLLEILGIKHYVSHPTRQGHHYEQGTWDGTELAKRDSFDAILDTTAMRVFEDYMQQCQHDGIKVILVNSPTYVGANQKTKGLDKVNAYFDSIASAYNTVYWNYNVDYPLCNDTANFCVSVHMNPQATHQFSIDFANDLKVYIGSLEQEND